MDICLLLSPFCSGDRRNVLPIKSLGSKVGIGLDPDGFSSSLDLMMTVGAFGFSGGLLGIQVVIPSKVYLQKGQKMQKPPLHVVQAYGWVCKTSWVYCISTMFPKSYPVASLLFTFRWKILGICGIKHRLIERE